MLGNYQLATQLVAFQLLLSSLELDRYCSIYSFLVSDNNLFACKENAHSNSLGAQKYKERFPKCIGLLQRL
jgi:hypothetical protein